MASSIQEQMARVCVCVGGGVAVPPWVASSPPSALCYLPCAAWCVCLCSSGRLPDKAPTLDKAVPLIKVLIELNGCGNEQMSGIKSKESDRPINKSEHNYNTGYAPQLQYC